MPPVLVVETGSGNNPSCNSYVTLAEVSAYQEEMGNLSWEAAAASPDNTRISAIIRACRAIDRLYGKRFAGAPKAFGTQSLSWPRVGAVVPLDNYSNLSQMYGLQNGGYLIPDTIVPPEVKKACCEAALIELNNPGDMTPDLDRGGRISSVKAGSVSVDFEAGASPLTTRTAIEGILRPLFKPVATEVELG